MPIAGPPRGLQRNDGTGPLVPNRTIAGGNGRDETANVGTQTTFDTAWATHAASVPRGLIRRGPSAILRCVRPAGGWAMREGGPTMSRTLFIGGLAVSVAVAVVVGVSLASASPGSGARVWGAPAGMLRFSKVAQAPAGGVITVYSKNAKETDVDEPPI